MNKLTKSSNHDMDAAIEPPRRKPFPKQVQEGEIAFVEMTQSCARELTDRIKAGVNDVAELLHRAHEGRAWTALGYASWKEYCRVEFQMSKPRAYQLLEFVEIKREIEESTFVDPPQNESQTRVLKSVSAEQRTKVWEEAVEATGGGQPTAGQIDALANRVSHFKEAPEISEQLRDEICDRISAALNRAWEELKIYPELEWPHFRSGVRAWLQRK